MPLVVYFDEVGNPTLDPSDKDFPVFAIVLFLCDAQCYINQIVPRVNQLKFDVFGHEGVILHSRDIRKAQGDFGFLTDPARRQPFYTALNEVMTACDYKLIAVAIRKDRHAAQYAYPLNPYDLSLLFAMERLVSVLEGTQQTEVTIVAEKRGEREDRELHAAFQQIVASGTAYVDQARFRRIRFTLKFLPKSMNIVGTQMADLAAYPIARHVLDSSKPNPAFDIVRPKLCRALKVFP
jgi:hypothetical protein